MRGGLAVVMAVLISLLGVRASYAADTDPKSSKTEVKADDKAEPGSGNTTGENPPPAAVPQLQLQDEGPSSTDTDPMKVRRARQATVAEESDERPFWKNWIFWAVTGVLVVGAVGVVAHAASKTNSSLAPCPPDIVVSLGCYGTGR